jgi:hypothetical protein
MKKIIYIIISGLFLLGGCTNSIENDLNVIERRIEKLEQRCKEMNTTLGGLRDIVEKLQDYDFITRVESILKGGRTIGYTLYFTNSDPVTLYNGTDAATPLLGVARGEDGVWYWTVQYSPGEQAKFITDNYGVRIPTSAASPVIKIENGYWMVTYDNGEIWHNLGRATGEDGVSFFESVEHEGDYYLFKLLNGTSIKLPTWSSFEKLEKNCQTVNDNLETFVKLVENLQNKTWVSDLVPIVNDTDTIGMTLQLTDGSSYSFYNGTGTNVPVIGAKRATDDINDNVWYWTIRYGSGESQWILDEKGKKIQANAPEGLAVKISLKKDKDDKYYWAIAYGSAEPEFLLCNGKKVQASVDVPEPAFAPVVKKEGDFVVLTLSGEDPIMIPMANGFNVTLTGVTKNIITMSAKDTVSFTCALDKADERAEVLPIPNNGFYASAKTSNHKSWTVTVISPASFKKPTTSKLNVLVANGKGAMKTIVITIQAK